MGIPSGVLFSNLFRPSLRGVGPASWGPLSRFFGSVPSPAAGPLGPSCGDALSDRRDPFDFCPGLPRDPSLFLPHGRSGPWLFWAPGPFSPLSRPLYHGR